MKKLIIFLILISISCKSKKIEPEPILGNIEHGFDVNAKVSKIDSIANFYLVYIENDKEFFKIISEKNQARPYNGVKVNIGENYTFKIQQLTNRKPSEQNSLFTPVNYLHITRCEYFERTKISTESSFELAKSSNLKGLYLTN